MQFFALALSLLASTALAAPELRARCVKDEFVAVHYEGGSAGPHGACKWQVYTDNNCNARDVRDCGAGSHCAPQPTTCIDSQGNWF